MVVRTRFRRFTYPVILYLVSGGIAGYFVWHAINGDRGLKVSDEYQKSIAMLQAELAATKAQEAQWENRIALMSGEAIDRDLLDEEARTLLGRVDKSDLVIFYNRRR